MALELLAHSPNGLFRKSGLRSSVDFVKPKEALYAALLLFKLMTEKQTSYVARHNFLRPITEIRGNESHLDITKYRSELAVMEVV